MIQEIIKGGSLFGGFAFYVYLCQAIDDYLACSFTALRKVRNLIW